MPFSCVLLFIHGALGSILNLTWTNVNASFIGGAAGLIGIEVYNDTCNTDLCKIEAYYIKDNIYQF